jgi:hypothetical protein
MRKNTVFVVSGFIGLIEEKYAAFPNQIVGFLA